MTELKKHHTKTDGVEAYHWANELDAERPSLVMVHGFRGDHHGMLKIATKLSANYNLFIPDLPGFGETPPLKDRRHDLGAYVDFLNQFIDSLELKTKPHLLAHSFGTTIASAFVSSHADKVDRLILLSPIATQPLPKVVNLVAKPMVSLLHIMPDRLGRLFTGTNLVADLMSASTTTTSDKNLRKWIKLEHRRYFNSFGSHRSMIEAMQASNSRHVAEFAHGIPNHTLIITGDKDAIGKSKHQVRLTQILKWSDIKVLPGVGHLTHYETPDQIAKYIQKFI
ncbi:MAG: alpha/beta hydrolase [Candidatus Nomurabacteria bacterium]|jgi:pimeloyl-ACP methyl ester carboxylesterase|nr:alpha/beta hydrolase [Candidatus Nomurabacteria bacterium]